MGRFGPGRTANPKATATSPATITASQSPLFTGAYIKGTTYNAGWADSPFDLRGYGGTATATFATNAGKGPSIIHWGQQWQRNQVSQSFFSGDHQAVRDYGAIPLLDWTPWDNQRYPGTNTQPAFSMDNIVAGNWDSYIDSWAAGAAAWGKPLFVRPMWEMNGTNWFPWQPGTNGTTTSNYVAAWQRIVTRCRNAGATNISWVWCPNINRTGAYPMTGLYPGDAYVDWVGLDGYCDSGNNVNFVNLFSASYNEVYTLASTSKPMMLGEWGCHNFTNVVGTKAQWLTDAFNQLIAGAFPRIRAAVYFNWDVNGTSQWSIENGTGAQAAYAAGIGNALFKGNVYSGLAGSPIAPPSS